MLQLKAQFSLQFAERREVQEEKPRAGHDFSGSFSTKMYDMDGDAGRTTVQVCIRDASLHTPREMRQIF